MNEAVRGSVIVEEAYALGKMLDHSSWRTEEPKLPRLITPSDIDYPGVPLVFDDRGLLMFCELSSHNTEWGELSTGQRWLYTSAISNSKHFAVLCTHNVRPEHRRQINTRHDIKSFQVMIWDPTGNVMHEVVYGNDRWQRFVFNFYGSQSTKLRKYIIGKSIGMSAK